METRAIAKTVRMTPRKAGFVCDLIRGKSVGEATAILKNTNRAAADAVLKVLNSAVANAEHNNKLDKSNLYVKEATANEGVRMKRFLPRAKGSASGLVKRTTHITVVVAENN